MMRETGEDVQADPIVETPEPPKRKGWPLGKSRKRAAETEDKFEKLLTLLTLQAQSQQPLTPETLKDILTQSATASAVGMHKALRPENETHPGISVYSHPDGDRAHPKPPMPFELFWNNYPVHKFPETETWREWELQMQLVPGEYRILRKDGTPMAVTVRGETDANGKLVKVWVEHNVSREEKWLVPPKPVVLHQLIHPGNLRQAFMDGMHEHLQSLMG